MGTWGSLCFFDSETSEKYSQRDVIRGLYLTGCILETVMDFPITWEWLRFGAVWKCFLLHSYHQGRFILKSSLLAGVCAGSDRRTMLVN